MPSCPTLALREAALRAAREQAVRLDQALHTQSELAVSAAAAAATSIGANAIVATVVSSGWLAAPAQGVLPCECALQIYSDRDSHSCVCLGNG